MSESSVIEWTDSTWNPWRGCDKVSPGCAYCYMFRDQRRYGRDPSVVVRCSPATFNAPLSAAWARVRAQKLAEKGAHHVFACSWSDWFHEAADEWRGEAWDIIRRTAGSTYQILTKRSERIADHLPADWGDGWPNVWLGVTIEHQRFVGRADDLRAVPAQVRFISAEPLLGPLVCPGCHGTYLDTTAAARWCSHCAGPHEYLRLDGIDWVIVGGESGGRAGRRLVDERNQPRADRIGWVRDLRDACRLSLLGASPETPTAFLFKQWGGTRPTSAGRLLDDRTWDQMPRPTGLRSSA